MLCEYFDEELETVSVIWSLLYHSKQGTITTDTAERGCWHFHKIQFTFTNFDINFLVNSYINGALKLKLYMDETHKTQLSITFIN